MRRLAMVATVVAGLGLTACAPTVSISATSSGGANAGDTTTTDAAATGDSPSNPVPLGQSASVDGWTMKVVTMAPERTDPVTSTTAPGFLSEVYTIQATRTASSPAAAIQLAPVLLASNHLTYNAISNPGCWGGTPDNNQVYSGGTTMHSACITIPASAATGVVLGLGMAEQTWFATS